MWYSLLDLEMPAPHDIRAHVTVNDDSPWFSGHFPDHPIVPGIAQLKMVADVIARARQESLWINRLTRVKFKKIVKPGEHLEILATATNTTGLYSFRITHETQDVCSGMISLDHQQHIECP
jgi:3-hydroxymyristoyl/3-hydroxydecanoyl-(acyl carrier protein) dehydratase